MFEFIYGMKQLEAWASLIDTVQKPHLNTFRFFTDKRIRARKQNIYILFSSTDSFGPSVSCFYYELFSLVNNSCRFTNIRGFLNFLSPS
uniref:NADH-plastoquinone oxidoreductase subunit 4 n=1 Tax=Castanopsis sieboldii TaxID=115717 RepID=UPI0020371ED7|nr:NADH-plastoquinone oxidoreductase subunit 4 [Castanopsis sieboldii]UQV81326.1 NADH-plastoquinone oxidoreductase subunit 4 [Castanopsis sieboldii]